MAITARKVLGIIIAVSIVGVLAFVGCITYQIFHPTVKSATTGSSDFPALNLLSGEIDAKSEYLVEANLRLYTLGKFNPKTAYILATGYKKTPQIDGTTSFQFYITVPEVRSTYQISFTTSITINPIITLVCAPQNLQPSSAQCYQPPDDDISYTHFRGIYA